MALTTADLQGLVAQFDEWVTDPQFGLTIEVHEKRAETKMVYGGLGARVTAQTFCLVRVQRGDVLVFEEAMADDYAVVRASVSVLSRTVGNWDSAERQADQ